MNAWNYRQSLNWKLESINGIVDNSAEKLGTGRFVLDEEQERVVGEELSGVAAKFVDQFDFYEKRIN